jgi:hypothetical protein
VGLYVKFNKKWKTATDRNEAWYGSTATAATVAAAAALYVGGVFPPVYPYFASLAGALMLAITIVLTARFLQRSTSMRRSLEQKVKVLAAQTFDAAGALHPADLRALAYDDPLAIAPDETAAPETPPEPDPRAGRDGLGRPGEGGRG